WDQTIHNYYASGDGTVPTFPDKATAQNYLNHLILQTLNPDLREVLTGTGGLLDATEKAIIAQHFHDGEDNAQIAHYLAGAYIGTAETMELQTGDTADYFVSTGGFEINIHDKFNTTLGMNWQDAAAVLRALYELEQDGFSHGTYTAEPVTVYPGDKNNLPYDVVVERLHVEKPEPPAPEPEKTPDEVLDEHPISIQVNGEWRTFPNAAAAEDAAYEEYKANI